MRINHVPTPLTLRTRQCRVPPAIMGILYFVRELFVVLALASQLKLELQSKICWLTQYIFPPALARVVTGNC